MRPWPERYRQDVLAADAAHKRWLAREFAKYADESLEWANATFDAVDDGWPEE